MKDPSEVSGFLVALLVVFSVAFNLAVLAALVWFVVFVLRSLGVDV